MPWPTAKLSPNARLHWGERNRAAIAYRTACKFATLNALNQHPGALSVMRAHVEGGGRLHVFENFDKPDRRARDDDNVFASFKAGRDGIADALGINDRHFRLHPFVTDIRHKGGRVRVRIVLSPQIDLME